MNTNPRDQPASDFPNGLSQPALRALYDAGYRRVEQLAGVREADIKRLHGMGPKGVDLLRRALSERGLAFAGASRSPRGPLHEDNE